MQADTDKEDMEGMRIYIKREIHQRMVFNDNNGGVDYEKIILHANMQDVYMNKRQSLINCGYSVKVSSSAGKKVVQEVLNNNFIEDPKDNDEI